MKYWGYMPNDFINGENISVSFWTSGCPHHCKGCFNQETWDPSSGYDLPKNIGELIIKAISANNINRNFSVLGGEPLCADNIMLIYNLVKLVRETYPNIKIYIWTGYTYEHLISRNDMYTKAILSYADVLIDGPFIQEQKDLTLKLRGSRNQRILYLGEKGEILCQK